MYRWFHGHAVPVHAPDGSIVRWCNLVTDIEERKQRRRSAALERAAVRAILDNIPALVAIHNASGELELDNRAAREYHGRSADDPKQWKISDVVHPDDLPCAHRGTAARGGDAASRSNSSSACGARTARIDGSTCGPVRSSDDYDGTSRWYSVGTDIHDRKTAEDALRRSEAFLLEVQRLSRTGGWRYDLATDVVESSPEIQRAYAVQPGEDISRPPFWFDRIHPEDRPRVQAQFEQCMREKTEYRAGYRIVLPDGSIRYQYATGHPVTNDAGDLVRVHRRIDGHDGALAGDHRAQSCRRSPAHERGAVAGSI